MGKESRRNMIRNFFLGVGYTTLGAAPWIATIKETTGEKLILRPPGAICEKDFLKKCIRCGICVEACPYDTLKLANGEDDPPIGTPYFEPRNIPCYMCTDVPCTAACPTDALDKKSLMDNSLNPDSELDINNSEMGLALIDQENCLAYWGIVCDACYRACPLLDEAITIEISRNERTGKHAMRLPIVSSEACTGCGMCEHACITEKASIIVLPKELVQGKVNNDYIKSWQASDESRIDSTNYYHDNREDLNETLDYLNDENDLFN